MYLSILFYQTNSARKLCANSSNYAWPQVCGDWCNSRSNWIPAVDQSFAGFVLADRTTSARSLTEPSNLLCIFISCCFFDEQHAQCWKLSVVRSFNHLKIISQRFIRAILDSFAVPLEAGLFLFCDACLFLLDASISLCRLNFPSLIVDS